MPSPRLLITIIAGIAAVAAFFAARGSYPPPSNWPLGFAMGALIIVYVLGSILWGVVQGMREAQKAPPGSPKPPAR
jgi:hypothetical protein